jgi:hypothetical protein
MARRDRREEASMKLSGDVDLVRQARDDLRRVEDAVAPPGRYGRLEPWFNKSGKPGDIEP